MYMHINIYVYDVYDGWIDIHICTHTYYKHAYMCVCLDITKRKKKKAKKIKRKVERKAEKKKGREEGREERRKEGRKEENQKSWRERYNKTVYRV